MNERRDIRKIVFEILEGRPFPENSKDHPEELIRYVGDSVLELIDVLSPIEIPKGLDFFFQQLRAEGVDGFINPGRLEVFLNVGVDYYSLDLLIRGWKQIDGDTYQQALEKTEQYLKENIKAWDAVVSFRKMMGDDTDYPELSGMFTVTMIYRDPRILEWELESLINENGHEPQTRIEKEIALRKRKAEGELEVMNKIEELMHKFAQDFGMEIDVIEEEWLCNVYYPDCDAWVISGDAVIVSPEKFLEMVEKHALVSHTITTEKGEYIVEYEIDGRPHRFGIVKIPEPEDVNPWNQSLGL